MLRDAQSSDGAGFNKTLIFKTAELRGRALRLPCFEGGSISNNGADICVDLVHELICLAFIQ